MSSTNKELDLSIVITAHSEGILIHKTLLSVERAIKELSNNHVTEIILHLDNPSNSTLEYIKANKENILKSVKIFTNHFGDLSASRNFSINKASGKYVATIDADDLMSKNWLKYSIDILKKDQKNDSVAHSEFTIEFGDSDVIIEKYKSIDRDHDTLLSVWSNRWNSVILAPRKLLLENPYPPNSAGYGYEDWWLNNTLLSKNIKQILIPETAIFVRRQNDIGEWKRQATSRSVLRANDLLSPKNIRSIKPIFKYVLRVDASQSQNSNFTQRTKRLCKRKFPLLFRLLVKVRNRLQNSSHDQKIATLPKWLSSEWPELNNIEPRIISPKQNSRRINWHPAITEAHKLAGALYKSVIDQLKFDNYDYLIFVPWLIVGGADKYIIDFANTIHKLKPNKRILILSTLPTKDTYIQNLNNSVEFVNFGNLAQNIHESEIKYRVLEHLIENLGIKFLHVMNSELGYSFINDHRSYIQATNKKVIATSFGRVTASNGLQIGYTSMYVPKIYDLLTFATSDNSETLRIWCEEYGFDRTKLLLHRQKVDLTDGDIYRRSSSVNGRLKILWAARIAPEKLPELVPKIGELVKDFADIDMYGWYSDKKYHNLLQSLPENVRYEGKFEGGLQFIPNQEQYHVYLYTSTADGTPNSLLEAIQLNLPIVAPAIGGIGDFIIDQKSGVLVKNCKDINAYVDALRQLQDSKLRTKLAHGAREIIQKDFLPESWENNIRKYIDKIEY